VTNRLDLDECWRLYNSHSPGPAMGFVPDLLREVAELRGSLARVDTAEAAYSALREAARAYLESHLMLRLAGTKATETVPRSMAARDSLHSALASNPASLAASYRERVRAEIGEELARDLEHSADSWQRQSDAAGRAHRWHAEIEGPRIRAETLMHAATRLRSLASGKDPK
jgi:hypothetical protein